MSHGGLLEMSAPLTIASSRLPDGPLEEVIHQVLGRVIDPELGVPITELGLVYETQLSDGAVSVVMTTTTPVCPLGSYLRREIARHLGRIPGITGITVEIVHSPPWSPEMMTDKARQMLGWAEPGSIDRRRGRPDPARRGRGVRRIGLPWEVVP